MKAIMRFFLSLKTTFGLLVLYIVLSVTGSIMLPSNLAFFSGIDETPLFRWLLSAGNIRLTWWLYGMIALLFLIAVNTIFCTVESLMKKIGMKNLILRLSPQIMHIGVLLIMLGHLLTASIGFKTDLLIKKGEEKTISGDTSIYLEDITVQKDENGYYTDWEAELIWNDVGKKPGKGILRPVHPLYFGRFGLYIQSVETDPEATALIRVCRDPGAVWALIGGILLSIGGAGFIYGKSLSLRTVS